MHPEEEMSPCESAQTVAQAQARPCLELRSGHILLSKWGWCLAAVSCPSYPHSPTHLAGGCGKPVMGQLSPGLWPGDKEMCLLDGKQGF